MSEHHWADTRALKKVCTDQTNDIAYIMERIADQSLHDAFDAYCVFQHAIVQALRLSGINSAEYHQAAIMADIHFKKMDKGFFEKEKRSLGLITSIDLRNHGKRLCKPLFRE